MNEILITNPLVFSIVLSLLGMGFFYSFFRMVISMEIGELEMNQYLKNEILDQCFSSGIIMGNWLSMVFCSFVVYQILTTENLARILYLLALFVLVIFSLIFFSVALMNTLIKKLHWATEVNRYPAKIGMVDYCKQMPEDKYSIILIEGSGDNQKSTEYPLSKEAFRKIEEKRGTVFRSPVVAFADPENGDQIVFLAREISTRKSNYAVL